MLGSVPRLAAEEDIQISLRQRLEADLESPLVTTGSITRSHTTKCQNENNIGEEEVAHSMLKIFVLCQCSLWLLRSLRG